MKTFNIFILFVLVYNYAIAQKAISVVESNQQVYLNQIDILGEYKVLTLENTKEEKYSLSIGLNSPELFYFLNTNDNSIKYFFLFPGDTVVIKSVSNSLSLMSSTPKENQILDTLAKVNADILFNHEGGKYSLFKNFDEANKNSQHTNNIRENIISINREVIRKDFFDIITVINTLKRLDFLLSPYNPCSPVPDFSPKEKSNSYFSEIDSLILKVNDIDKKYIATYSFWLSKILLNYSNYTAKNYSSFKFECKFNSAKIFNSYIKNIYLTIIMSDKINNEYINKEYLSKYLSSCTEDSLKLRVVKIPENLQRIIKEESIQNSILYSTDNKKITWRDLSQSSLGRVMYIDLWASWCAGCKLNISKIKEMKKKFPSLDIVFISRDASKEKWIKSIHSWGIQSLGRHYNIEPQSELSKILTEPSIPRGTLIDSKGIVATIDADAPDSSQLNTWIKSLMNTQKK